MSFTSSLGVGEQRLMLTSGEPGTFLRSCDVRALAGLAKVRELFPEAGRGLGRWTCSGQWRARAGRPVSG